MREGTTLCVCGEAVHCALFTITCSCLPCWRLPFVCFIFRARAPFVAPCSVSPVPPRCSCDLVDACAGFGCVRTVCKLGTARAGLHLIVVCPFGRISGCIGRRAWKPQSPLSVPDTLHPFVGREQPRTRIPSNLDNPGFISVAAQTLGVFLVPGLLICSITLFYLKVTRALWWLLP